MTAAKRISIQSVTASDIPTAQTLAGLYESVGWTIYSADPEKLERAVHASSRVCVARISDDAGEHLVGLARAVGDGETIVYVQDILVAPSARRMGVGKRLMECLLEPFTDVRQTVLITDTEEAQRKFYVSAGFAQQGSEETGIRTFAIFR